MFQLSLGEDKKMDHLCGRDDILIGGLSLMAKMRMYNLYHDIL